LLNVLGGEEIVQCFDCLALSRGSVDDARPLRARQERGLCLRQIIGRLSPSSPGYHFGCFEMIGRIAGCTDSRTELIDTEATQLADKCRWFPPYCLPDRRFQF